MAAFIHNIIARKAPEKIRFVDNWLVKYKGRYGDLILGLCEQYKEPIPKWVELPPRINRMSEEERAEEAAAIVAQSRQGAVEAAKAAGGGQ